MKITLDRSTLENLLHRAAFAAHLVGHLDDNTQPDLIGQLSDHVDAVAHGLSEVLGDHRTHTAYEAVSSNDGIACNGALKLTCGSEVVP